MKSAELRSPMRFVLGLPAPIRVALWMAAAGASYGIMMGAAKHLSEVHQFNAFVMTFWRNVFAIAIFLPWLMTNGLSALKSQHTGLLVVRSGLMTVTSMAIFLAVILMPVAEATALTFTIPLFGAIMSMIVLGEVFGARRWAALAVGACGVFIILRPGSAAVDWAALLPLLAALTYAGVVVTGKMLAPLESPGKIAVYVGIYSVPLALVPAIIYWQWPTAQQFLWLLVIGAASGLNLYTISRALFIGDASQSLPYDFLRLPFAALVAFMMFGQIPEIWTWLGAVIIFASAVFVTYSDTRLATSTRPGTAPSSPPGKATGNSIGTATGKPPRRATPKQPGR